MRVLVVGAGIGGLGVAIGLRRAGHEVVVFERAGQLAPLGAGITLWGNAMRALERLGVRDAVAADGTPPRRSAIRTSSGRVLAEVPRDLLEGAIGLHRADLQAALAGAAGDVRLGAEVVAIQQDSAGVTVTLAGGREEQADAVIGADGIHSRVRGALFADVSPRYAGYTAWRAVVRREADPGSWTESWGVGARFGLIDIGDGRTYWFATENAAEGEHEPGGRKAEIEQRFRGWHEPIESVIDATDEDAIFRHDVYYLDQLPRWWSGRVCLLGDAAHATTPGIGQGAAQALEDAVALVESLSSRDELGAAYAAYEARRRPRTAAVLRISRRADRGGQLANPLACRFRNFLVRRMPASAQRRQLEPFIKGGV